MQRERERDRRIINVWELRGRERDQYWGIEREFRNDFFERKKM